MDELISTIYIGGGTPSCLTNEELDKLFNIVSIFKKVLIVNLPLNVIPKILLKNL